MSFGRKFHHHTSKQALNPVAYLHLSSFLYLHIPLSLLLVRIRSPRLELLLSLSSLSLDKSLLWLQIKFNIVTV